MPTFRPIDDRLTIDPARCLSITRISCLSDSKAQTLIGATAWSTVHLLDVEAIVRWNSSDFYIARDIESRWCLGATCFFSGKEQELIWPDVCQEGRTLSHTVFHDPNAESR
jgi:hypothetical protein